MKEVSCRAIPALRLGAEFVGVTYGELIRDLPYSEQHLENPRNRIDWDDYATIVDRIGERCTDQTAVDLGRRFYPAESPLGSFLGSLSGYFTSLQLFYRFMHRFAVPSLQTNLIVNHETLSQNRIRITLEVPPPHRDSRAFFLISAGCIAAVPCFLGLPEAIVDFHIEPRRGVYTVRLPPDATIWARLRRAFKALFAARAAIEELHAQYLEMAREHSQMTDMHLGFQEIIERMPAGIIVLREGEIVYANRVIQGALGVESSHELKGRSLRDCVIEQDLPVLERAVGEGTRSQLPLQVRFAGKPHSKIMEIQVVSGIQFGGCASDFLIAHDVTENRRLEKEIIGAASREQRRLSHELHDGPMQVMAGVCYKGGVIVKRLRRAESPFHDRVAEIVTLNREALEETRAIARRADPVSLNSDGLLSALHDLAESVRDTYGVACAFRQDGDSVDAEHEAAVHLYRIAQEATGNAVRHGAPRTVSIKLSMTDERVTLTVEDDGMGMPTDAQRSDGMWLRNMQYRARMIGATFTIQPNEPHGTVVTCVLPAMAS